LLRAYLDDTGRSQLEVADKLNRSPAAVCMWLQGKTLPDVDSAAALEDLAGVPMRAWSQKPRGGNRRKAA
jgi:transcriptional regulator with XRE-family HTH domain